MARSAIMSVRITGNATDAVNAMEKATKKAAAFGSFMGGMAVKGVTALWDTVKGFAGDVVNMSDSTDKFMSTMGFAGLDTTAVQQAAKAARQYADETVYGLDDIQNTTAQLAANGIGNYTELTQAAGNLNAVAGGNADTFKSVAMMLTQTAGAGKLTTENWNQLTDAIPGASGKLQEALLKAGAYTGNFRDAMADGQITADEFNQALLDLGMTDVAKQAATSTSTIEGAVGNLEASVVGGLNDLFAYVKPLITTLLVFVTGRVDSAFGWIRDAIDGLGEFIRTGDINDAFAKAFGSDAWSNDALNALFTIRQTLVGFIDTAKGKLKDARQTVSDFMGGFMDTAPIDVFVAMLSNIWDAAASGIDALGSFGRTVMSIIDMLNPLSGTAIQASDAGAMLGGAFQTAGSLIAAASGIIQTVAGALTQVSGWIDEHGDAVSATLLDIGTGLAVFKVAGIIQAVAGAMQGFSVATAAASAATQIATAAQAAFNLVMEMNPLVLVISLLAALTAGLVYFFTQTKTGQQAWSSFTNFISGCLTSIGNLFRNLGNSIGSIFTSAADGATKTWNNVANWFSNLPGRIGGFFSNAGSLLVNAGASIINGFWDGLKSMWSNVTGWISGIGDWIKAHKGPISYDRRLLIPAGQAIMTGFAQGLNNGFDNSVETAISRANRRLAAMPLNLSAQGNTAAPAVVNTWNVEINGEVIDKDGTAKAIKRLLADYDARRS